MEALGRARPSLDEQLNALAHVQRRRVLLALREENSRGIEIGAESGRIDTQEALLAARHNHLPKLEELGFVRWDRSSDVVTKGPQFGEVEPLLTLLDEHRDELPVE